MQSVIELINNNKHTYTCTEYIASNIVVDRHVANHGNTGANIFPLIKSSCKFQKRYVKLRM